jgi:predicted RNA-binding protein (virulence factor B family)
LAASEKVVDNIRKLGKKYNCPIVTILHQNPGTTKERGHFGSELLRKAESIIEIKKDGPTSTLIGKDFRNCGSIPEVHFEYNKELGYHTTSRIITQQQKNEANQEAKKTKTNKAAEELREVLSRIFKDGAPMRYNDIAKAIEQMTGLSTPTANRRIEKAKELGILTMTVAGLYRFIFDSESL